MNQDQFWQLIEAARIGADAPTQDGVRPTPEPHDEDCERLVERLQLILTALPEEEIIRFDRELDARMAQSYTRPLWAATYLINGGCLDDAFDYFRGWLISKGRVIYEAALADPQSLADLDDPLLESGEVDCERLLYAALQAYETKTGRSMPQEPLSWELSGAEWDEDKVDDLYPRLAARFPL